LSEQLQTALNSRVIIEQGQKGATTTTGSASSPARSRPGEADLDTLLHPPEFAPRCDQLHVVTPSVRELVGSLVDVDDGFVSPDGADPPGDLRWGGLWVSSR
jgi:hypothetical protein